MNSLGINKSKKDTKVENDKSEPTLRSRTISKSVPLRHSVSKYTLNSELGDEPFEDALDDTATCFNVPIPPNELHNTSSEESLGSSELAQVLR